MSVKQELQAGNERLQQRESLEDEKACYSETRAKQKEKETTGLKVKIENTNLETSLKQRTKGSSKRKLNETSKGIKKNKEM